MCTLDKKYNDGKNKVYPEYRVPPPGRSSWGGQCAGDGGGGGHEIGRRKDVFDSKHGTMQRRRGQNANCTLAPCTLRTFPYMSKQQLYLGGRLQKNIKRCWCAYKLQTCSTPPQELTTMWPRFLTNGFISDVEQRCAHCPESSVKNATECTECEPCAPWPQCFCTCVLFAPRCKKYTSALHRQSRATQSAISAGATALHPLRFHTMDRSGLLPTI